MATQAQTIANYRYAQLFACLSTLFNHFTINMQNKPNLLNTQMNVNTVAIRAYENTRPFSHRENKPNSNPIQSQSNPISKQNKPNQTQFQSQKMLFHLTSQAKDG